MGADTDADAEANIVVEDVKGGEQLANDVVDPVGDDIDGGDALPLSRGGNGSRDRAGLGATLTLPPRSIRMSFGLVNSEASASAKASSVDMGMGIGTGAAGPVAASVEVEFVVVEEGGEEGGGTSEEAGDAAEALGGVLRKYMGSS